MLWRFLDDNHFYYLVLKPNGWEIGKADPAYPIDVGLRWGDEGYEITGWIAGKKEQEDR